MPNTIVMIIIINKIFLVNAIYPGYFGLTLGAKILGHQKLLIEGYLNINEPLSYDTDKQLRQQKENWKETASQASGILREEELPKTNLNSGKGFPTEVLQLEENELSYACLIIPRFADQFLSGDITQNLPVWLMDICISFGWRLGSIVIRPGYMQWGVSALPATSPGSIIRIIRRYSSQKILYEFPRYKQQNPAGDFWAPGYNVSSGSQLLTLDEISSFIKITRLQQGIY